MRVLELDVDRGGAVDTLRNVQALRYVSVWNEKTQRYEVALQPVMALCFGELLAPKSVLKIRAVEGEEDGT